MNKLIVATCFSLASLALLPASYAGPSDTDPAQHARRAGVMSSLPGTTLAPAPQLEKGDPERALITAGVRNGLPGSYVPAERRFRVAGADDPVRAPLSAGIMTSRPYDFAPAQ